MPKKDAMRTIYDFFQQDGYRQAVTDYWGGNGRRLSASLRNIEQTTSLVVSDMSIPDSLGH